MLSQDEKYQLGYGHVIKKLEKNPELVREFLEVFELTGEDWEGPFDRGCYNATLDFSRQVNGEVK